MNGLRQMLDAPVKWRHVAIVGWLAYSFMLGLRWFGTEPEHPFLAWWAIMALMLGPVVAFIAWCNGERRWAAFELGLGTALLIPPILWALCHPLEMLALVIRITAMEPK